MKLSVYDLNKVRTSVLADMPAVDYKDEIRQRCHAIAYGFLPPAVKSMWDRTDLRPWVNTRSCWTDMTGSVYLPCTDNASELELEHAMRDDPEIKRLYKLQYDQDEARDAADAAMKAAFRSIRTRETFVERFPDLVSYLPAEETAPASMPVSTDMMDKIRAAGWPVKKAA